MDKSIFGLKGTRTMFVVPETKEEQQLVAERRCSSRRIQLERRREARLHLNNADRREHPGRRDCDYLAVMFRSASG